jgi:hypothetical protein
MKMPIRFDTLDYAKKLTDSGIPAEQAEAHASALGEVLANAVAVPGDLMILKQDVLTHLDQFKYEIIGRLEDVKHNLLQRIDAQSARMDVMELRMRHLEWLLGVVLAVNTGILVKLLVP